MRQELGLSYLKNTRDVPWNDAAFEVENGLVLSASCVLDDWIKHGPALVAMHPVRKVALTDRKACGPWSHSTIQDEYPAHGSYWIFLDFDFAGHPHHWFPRWKEFSNAGMGVRWRNGFYYASPEEAARAVSWACLNWAVNTAKGTQ
jgi:hypothetical protein